MSNTILRWDQIRPSHGRSLGQKCARLAYVKQMGLPVPPFFALTSEAVGMILKDGQPASGIRAELRQGLNRLEAESGRALLDPIDPLLLAVRSGDPVHLAGAMTSFINVGLGDVTLPALAVKQSNEPAVLRMYLDLMVDFALKVAKVDRAALQPVLWQMRENPTEPETLRILITRVKNLYPDFPQDPQQQLFSAVAAIALAWEGPELEPYKETLGLRPELLPSVIVQQMAFSGFGNSAFAAFCTRNPVSGARGLTGEFARNVEGRRVMRGNVARRSAIGEIDRYFPGTYEQLQQMGKSVEVWAKHPQDMEVVIENGRVRIIQSVDATLSNNARFRIAAEFREEGILARSEGLTQADSRRVAAVMTYQLNPRADFIELAKGIPANPGAVLGRLALSVEAADEYYRSNQPAVLLITEPDERVLHLLLKRTVAGFAATYGSTHDAAVARLSLIPAAMSFRDLRIAKDRAVILPDGSQVREGETIILDGEGGMLLRSDHHEPVLPDKIVTIAPHGLDGYQLERATRARLQAADYETLLPEHSALVKEIKARSLGKSEPVEIASLELTTHFVHFMILEQGRLEGLSAERIGLDLAQADGNLDRLPGFERQGYLLKKTFRAETIPLSRAELAMQRVFGRPATPKNRRIEELIIITLVYIDEPARAGNEAEMAGYKNEKERLTALRQALDAGGVPAEIFEDSQMVDAFHGRTHSGVRRFVGLRFPEADLERVLRFLK